MKFYVLKLLPPRPTFVADMTAEERQLMQAHSAYWSALMAQGKVVIFGPVADPAGPYGLAVVRLEEEVDPRSLCSDDPVIKAEKGFRFEVSPMLRAVVP